MKFGKIIALALLLVTVPTLGYYAVFNVQSRDSSVNHFNTVLKSNKLTVVRFSSVRCGCSANRPQAPRPIPAQPIQSTSTQKFTSLAQQYPSIYWLDVSTAQYPDIRNSAKLAAGQEAIVFYRNGAEVHRINGNYDPAQVRSLIKQHFNI